MTIELRTLEAGAWDPWYQALEWAFGGVAESTEERALWRDLTELERSLAAREGGRIVGGSSAFSLGLSVPGGAVVPTGGLTMVGVAATHRRRGLLSRMMRWQLDGMRDAGEPLAVLTASEPAIYGRFGFGTATYRLSAEIDTDRVRLEAPPGTEAVSLRLAEPAAELARCEEVYARAVPARPGMLERRPHWERLPLLDPPQERGGASPLRCVLAERDGEPVGYARYAMRPEWEAAGPRGTVIVRDLQADDPAAHAALLRHLAGVDLMTSLRLPDLPVDDPVLHLASDVRRCRPRVTDRLHLRPVEVGPALAARTYAAEVDVVLEVTDAFCPWNEGRWRLSGGPGGALCTRTGDAPGLALSVNELGAALLGGTSLAALARAGRVRELRAGALAEAATAFGVPLAPWLPHLF